MDRVCRLSTGATTAAAADRRQTQTYNYYSPATHLLYGAAAHMSRSARGSTRKKRALNGRGPRLSGLTHTRGEFWEVGLQRHSLADAKFKATSARPSTGRECGFLGGQAPDQLTSPHLTPHQVWVQLKIKAKSSSDKTHTAINNNNLECR